MQKKPIVSSLVHFYTQPTTARDEMVKPSAAIVTAVNADGTVNLFVFHTGEPTAACGIAKGVKQGDPVVNRDGKLWCWPPIECTTCPPQAEQRDDGGGTETLETPTTPPEATDDPVTTGSTST